MWNFWKRNISISLIQWGIRDVVFLSVCLLIAILFVARAAGLLFEFDDFRYLWWADQHLWTPWTAFMDAPLFKAYYRPVVSLIWWLHYVLFGMEHYLHQMAVVRGGFRLSASLSDQSEIMEFCHGVYGNFDIFAMYASHSTLVWKSGLPQQAASLFRLGCIYLLLLLFEKTSYTRYFFLVLILVLALLTKESAQLCLPCTLTAFLIMDNPLTKKQRGTILALVWGIAVLVLMSNSVIRGYAGDSLELMTRLDRAYFNDISFFAGRIWGYYPLVIIALIAAIYAFLFQRNKSFLLLPVYLVLWGALFYYLYKEQVDFFLALALSLSISLYFLLLLLPVRKLIPFYLWFTLSFFPLPLLQLPSIPYALDATVALALILGYLASLAAGFVTSATTGASTIACMIFRNAYLLILGFLLPLQIGFSFLNYHEYVSYIENWFHRPMAMVLKQAQSDYLTINFINDLVFSPGERTTLETYIALNIKHLTNLKLQPVTEPPQEYYRLEASRRNITRYFPLKIPGYLAACIRGETDGGEFQGPVFRAGKMGLLSPERL